MQTNCRAKISINTYCWGNKKRRTSEGEIRLCFFVFVSALCEQRGVRSGISKRPELP